MSGLSEEPLGRSAARAARERAIAEPTLERIGARLTAHCGLAFGSHNRPDLVRAVWSVVSELGLASPEHLASLVEHPSGVGPLARLVGELTVRESYFFRLPEQFAYLRARVVPELVRQRRARGSTDRTVRAWSAGCAGGEEAYSLAIALHEAVDPGWNVEVLGTDINASYLDQARAADYSPWSLRGVDEVERARYFVSGDRGTRRVREDLRRLVRFLPLNLAGAGYPEAGAGTGGLDVVFCRNVFIYFDAEVVARVTARLATCLHDVGFAFFGPSDPLPARIAGLERVSARGATMVFRRPAERAGAGRGSELRPAHRPSSTARGAVRDGARPA
ncbi:MAG: protein-glutamate O-methyltransferase CheR, partial [Myxococcales bacterium]|nr:protein-glutamate O-methyltransferase CheR [Myxococcales bacterium]